MKVYLFILFWQSKQTFFIESLSHLHKQLFKISFICFYLETYFNLVTRPFLTLSLVKTSFFILTLHLKADVVLWSGIVPTPVK